MKLIKVFNIKIIVSLIVIIVLFILGFPLAMFTNEMQGRVSFKESIELPFSINDEVEVILLYFGYVGCQTICVPSLKEIALVSDEFNDSKRVLFYFVNIAEKSELVKEYAKYFHKNFIGLNLAPVETSKLMGDLRAYSSDSLSGDGEISHTGYLYLIKNSGQQNFELKQMYYTRPFDTKSIVTDIKKEFR